MRHRIGDPLSEEIKLAVENAALAVAHVLEACKPASIDHQTFVQAVFEALASGVDVVKALRNARVHSGAALRSPATPDDPLSLEQRARTLDQGPPYVTFAWQLDEGAPDAPKPQNVFEAVFGAAVVRVLEKRLHASGGGEPVEATPDAPKPENASPAVARALERGRIARAELEEDEGGSKSSEQIAELLGITRQAVDQRRRARRLVAWQNDAGHWRFPVWQFDPQTARPYPGLPPILAALPGDPWSDMIFFLSRDETLGTRPLDLLRGGRAKRVVPAALRYAGQGA
jgi:hypothetical protein